MRQAESCSFRSTENAPGSRAPIRALRLQQGSEGVGGNVSSALRTFEGTDWTKPAGCGYA
ncbi:hypothetical protein AB6A23_25870 [Paenibacillus tarimensis]